MVCVFQKQKFKNPIDLFYTFTLIIFWLGFLITASFRDAGTDYMNHVFFFENVKNPISDPGYAALATVLTI